MPVLTVDVVQWLVNQGVAIAVLVIVLVRFDAQLTLIAKSLQQLVDGLPRTRGGKLQMPRATHRQSE
jgi:hypothetical protein